MAMVAIFRMHYDKAENYAKSSYKIAKYIKNECKKNQNFQIDTTSFRGEATAFPTPKI